MHITNQLIIPHLAFNAKINDALPFLLDLFLYTSQNQKQYGKKKNIFLCDFPPFVHITTPTVLGNRFNQFKP